MVGTRGPRVMGKLGRQSAKNQRAMVAKLAVKTSTKMSSKTSTKPAPKVAKSPPPKMASSKKTPAKTPEPKANLPGKVRVWWPPTTVKKKTDLSGMYWPATVESKVGSNYYNVKYDNGEVEKVAIDKCAPYNQVVKHGKEKSILKVGEFCEVLNGSKTDPAEWLARVVGREGTNYTVSYPFHDTEDEVQPQSLVRRARVFHEKKGVWMCLDPKQNFKDGQVETPLELKLCSEEAIATYEPKSESKKPAPKAKATPKKETAKEKEKPTPKKKKADKAPEEKPAKKQKTTEGGAAEPKQRKSKSKDPEMEPYEINGRTVMVPSELPMPPPASEGKKKRRPKDPAAPKRPINAYLAFLDLYRPVVKQKHPSYTVSQVTTECAKLWREVSAEERMQCNERATEDRARYDREMKEYKLVAADSADSADGGAGPADNSKAKKRKKKDKDAPRKARTAFILFSMDFREKNKKKLEEAGFDGASKNIGEAWGKLKDTERKKWVAMADEEAILYKTEMFAYKEAKAERDAKAQDEARHAYAEEAFKREVAAEKVQRKAEREAKKAAKAAGGKQVTAPGPLQITSAMVGAMGVATLVSPVSSVVDMAALRDGVLSVTKGQDAYYTLVDAMHGENTKARVEMALVHAQIGDWKAFLVAALGLDKVKKHLK